MKTPVSPKVSHIGPNMIVENVLPSDTYTPNTPKAIPSCSLGALLVTAELAAI